MSKSLILRSLIYSFCFLFSFQLFSQIQLSSSFGDVHSPKGDLHVLLIFVRYSNADLMKGSKNWPNKSEEGVLPKMAMGEINDFFYPNRESLENASDRLNISDFYYTMSDGKFRLTGDIFPIQVPVKYIGENKRNFFSRQSDMNQAAINWIAENYPDFDWAKYDHRKNKPRFRSNNSETEADGILDYVIFMHRAPGSTGMGSTGSLEIPGSSLKIRHGHTGIRSYSNKEHNWEYFKHEFAHNLYSCPHYLGANGADGNKYYPQKGWGMMAAWHAPFFTANAWEAWWLNWMDVQEVEEAGTYRLKDFVRGRDALRIKIPGTDDFLWLENHQKIDKWDDKVFFKDKSKGEPQSAKGIYAYVVGAPGADRNKPQLNPFSNKHANMIKMLNAEGNFDYRLTGEQMHTGYFMSPVLEKLGSNPMSGQNSFQRIRLDYDGNGQIQVGMAHGNSDGGNKESKELWTEMIEGKAVCHIGCTGDENDAFEVGDELGLSGIVPILNYPIYNKKEEALGAHILNGISILIKEKREDGSYMLEISFDDWEIRNSRRWCGNLQIPAFEGEREIDIKKKVSLQLDLSATPIRIRPNPVTETFTNPSKLKVLKGNTLKVEKKAELIIENHSKLLLESGAKILIQKGGKLILRKNGILDIKEGAEVLVQRGGRLIIEESGKLRQDREENLILNKGAKMLRQDLP